MPSCTNGQEPINPGKYVTLQEASAIVQMRLGSFRGNKWLYEHLHCRRPAAEISMTSRSNDGQKLFCLDCLYGSVEISRTEQLL